MLLRHKCARSSCHRYILSWFAGASRLDLTWSARIALYIPPALLEAFAVSAAQPIRRGQQIFIQRRRSMTRRVSRREFLRSLSLGAGLVTLAACGGTPAAPAATSAPAPAAPTAAPADTGAAPTAAPADAGAATAAPAAGASTGSQIVSSPLTLTYWAEMNTATAATRKSFGEMSCYVEQEKRTGIHLEFQHPPTGPNQALEQFNLMIAGGNYPDIIEWNWISPSNTPGGPAKMLKDGVIVRLNELIDQHAPNFKKVLDEHPDWRKQIVTDEGDIYAFTFLRGDPALLTFAGPVVRKDYLDKYNLQPPTTIDEWHSVLTALKGKDLNGNGQNDDWPFSPWKDNSARGGFNNHAFVGAWGVTTGFYQDGGTVKFGPAQPEFKEFLKTMVAWNSEGLIDPDAVSMDLKAYDAKVTGGQLGTGVMNVGGGIGKYMGLMAEKDPNFKIVGVPYPTLKAGEKPQLGQRDNIYPGSNSAAITSANQHQVETVKLLDYAYSPEGHMLFNFGVEGLTYTLDNGYPKFTDLIMKNPDKLPLAQSMSAHFRSNFAGPFVQDKRYLEQYFQIPEQQDAYKTWQQPTNEKLMPPVTPTQDESRQYARIMAEVNTRFDEVFAKVITGAEPLESWDTFVEELKQIGVDEAVQVQQAALDRYNKRA
jgi:putative aldouronate transport system substrate-binding protein